MPTRNIGEELKKADHGVFACRAQLQVAFPIDRDFLAGLWLSGEGAASASIIQLEGPGTLAGTPVPHPSPAPGASQGPRVHPGQGCHTVAREMPRITNFSLNI